MEDHIERTFLLEDLCFGGTQRQNVELALRLDRARFRPAILTLTGPTDLDRKVLDGNITLVHLGSNRKAAPLFRAAGFRHQETAAGCHHPRTALPNIWGRLWGQSPAYSRAWHCARGRRANAPARAFLWPLAAHTVCNSRALFNVMRKIGVPENRLSFIANGVDTEKIPSWRIAAIFPQTVNCLRCQAGGDKDHATLLRAFELVARQHPHARLRLVGDGPEETALRKLAAQLEPCAASRVEFAGAADEPAPHYREGRVFALSSIREGTPNVVMEAMASGTPVCATAVGGIPELLGKNGLLPNLAIIRPLRPICFPCSRKASFADELGRNGRMAIERGFHSRP